MNERDGHVVAGERGGCRRQWTEDQARGRKDVGREAGGREREGEEEAR